MASATVANVHCSFFMGDAQPSFATSNEPMEETLPRLWWTKRLLLAAGISAVFFTGSIFLCHKLAARSLAANLAAIHARGEPILDADFAPEPVRDSENAALLYNAAATPPRPGLPTALRIMLDERSAYTPVNAADLPKWEELKSGLNPMLDLVRQARPYTKADWGARPASPLKAANLYGPHLINQIQLARMLSNAARYEHLTGHDASAVEILRDMVAHDEILDQSTSFQLSHVTATQLRGVTNATADVVAFDLKTVAESDAATLLSGPASKQQITALINALLDD